MVAVDKSSKVEAVAAVTTVASACPKDGNATLDVVQGRLEELLSKQNLTEDAYIQQNMNAQMYIPLAILASHQLLGGLGVDIGMLLAAARRSDKLGVDEENFMVRPLLKPRRNTLILHDLPEGISEGELRELFAASPESLSAVKPDVNHTAFVTFKTDEAAQSAALWLRSQTLRGASIKCAVKSEHFLRSFFPAATMSQVMQGYTMQGQQVMWGTPPWMVGPSPGQQQYQWQEYWGDDPTAAAGPQGQDVAGCWGADMSDGGKSIGANFKDRGGKAKGKGKRRAKGGGCGKSESAAGASDLAGTPDQNAQKGAEATQRAMQDFSASQGMSLPQDPPDLASASDLAVAGTDLHAADTGGYGAPSASPGCYEEESEENVGYTHGYRRYTRQQIIEVCNRMDEITKPESYIRFEEENPDGAALFCQFPCKDWAPLPTPQIPFMMSGDGKRSMDSGEHGEGYGGGRSRKGTGSSWSRSRATSGSVDVQQEEDSGNWGDDWSGEGGRWRRKSSWTDRSSWPAADSWEEAGYKGSWGSRSRSSSRAMSWVEKAKAGDAAEKENRGGKGAWGEKGAWGQQQPKWLAKARVDEATGKDSGEGNAATTDKGDSGEAESSSANVAAEAPPSEKESSPAQAPPSAKESSPAQATPSSAGKGQAQPSGAAENPDVEKKPSWADKVRQGKSVASPASAPSSIGGK